MNVVVFEDKLLLSSIQQQKFFFSPLSLYIFSTGLLIPRRTIINFHTRAFSYLSFRFVKKKISFLVNPIIEGFNA